MKRFTLGDIEIAMKRYQETGDAMFLVLTIGSRPHDPPAWAIEACVDECDAVTSGFESGAEGQRMGRRLDAMWWHLMKFLDDGEGRQLGNRRRHSVRAAASHAIISVDAQGPDWVGYDAKLKAVQRAWGREQKTASRLNSDYEISPGVIATPRFDRVLEEWGAHEFGLVTSRDAALAIFRMQRGHTA